MFEPGISPCKSEFPDIKIKRQIIEYYFKNICNLTQQNEFTPYNSAHQEHFMVKFVIQTDDIDFEFSKVFTEYIRSIQYQNSQRANSIFTNEVFAIIYSYVSILERTEAQSTSPVQTSNYTKVRNEIVAFSTFLNAIPENFTNYDVSENTKLDLQKILVWFISDYFTHNIDLIEQARKTFRLQSTNDDTVIAEQSDYVWTLNGLISSILKFSSRYLKPSNKYNIFS